MGPSAWNRNTPTLYRYRYICCVFRFAPLQSPFYNNIGIFFFLFFFAESGEVFKPFRLERRSMYQKETRLLLSLSVPLPGAQRADTSTQSAPLTPISLMVPVHATHSNEIPTCVVYNAEIQHSYIHIVCSCKMGLWKMAGTTIESVCILIVVWFWFNVWCICIFYIFMYRMPL